MLTGAGRGLNATSLGLAGEKASDASHVFLRLCEGRPADDDDDDEADDDDLRELAPDRSPICAEKSKPAALLPRLGEA